MLSMALLMMLASFSISAAQSTDPDQVTALPGLSADVCWNHFSGYLPASGDHKLFYCK